MRALFFAALLGFGQPVSAEAPKVVTDIAPLHGLVAALMENVAVPTLLLEPGTDPHHYALRPSEARALSQADLVFWVGPDLTPWLTKSLDSLAINADINALLTESIALETRDDNHDEHDEHQDDGQDHSHDHHGVDPHAWLDPDVARIWLDQIRAELSQADPENAQIYQDNARAMQARLNDLTAEIETGLNTLPITAFLASHDSYQYFENRFGLTLAGAISPNDATAPSPKKLRDIRELAQSAETTCFATDVEASPALIETVTAGTSLTPVLIDPLGRGLEPGPDFYPQLLLRIAEGFQTCLDAPS